MEMLIHCVHSVDTWLIILPLKQLVNAHEWEEKGEFQVTDDDRWVDLSEPQSSVKVRSQ